MQLISIVNARLRRVLYKRHDNAWDLALSLTV